VPLPAAWWRWQYNRESKAWDRRSDEPHVTAMRDDVVAMLLGARGGDGPLLDVGCGPGAHARELPGFVVGSDIAPGMLRVAAGHGGAALVQADLGRGLPFADGAFAGALALLVLQHVPDPHAAVVELCRVLQPGAPFIVSVPATDGQLIARRGLYWRLRAWAAQMPGLIHRFSEADVRTLVSDLEVVELRLVGTIRLALLRNAEAL
jgi:SAM-dependent methyltransferase